MTAVGRAAVGVGGEGGVVLTAASIAGMVRGQLIGNPDVEIDAVAPLDLAGPRDLSFLAAERYAGQFAETRAGVVLVSPALANAEGPARTRIVVERPHDAMIDVLPALYRQVAAPIGIDATAVLGRGVTIGDRVSIGPAAVIGERVWIGDGVVIGARAFVGDDARIGAGSRLFPGASLYANSQLGERVIVHTGAVIGSDGFGYVYRDNRHERIPHVGRCLIGNDVEIGANTTIDRGSIGDTTIGAGTKIDNLVQIGHNVRIGRLCLLMAQVGIAGSSRIEDGVVLAGQAGISGHVTIGAGARIAAQAGVFGDVPAGETWSGYPARPHTEALRAHGALFKLSRLLRPIERLVQDAEKGAKR